MKITITHRDPEALALLPLQYVFECLQGSKAGGIMPGGAPRPGIRLDHVASEGLRVGTVTVLLNNHDGKPERVLMTFRIDDHRPDDNHPQKLTLDHFSAALFYAELSVLFSNGAVHTEKVYPGSELLLDLMTEAKSGWFTTRHDNAVTTRRVEGVQAVLKFIDE